jgi:PAS domain S-box-containing protein
MKDQNSIDRHVGQRLRQLRLVRSLDLQSLSHAIGVSESRLRQMEQGCERIAAAVILRLSNLLEVRPSEFFAGFAIGETKMAVGCARGKTEGREGASAKPFRTSRGMALQRNAADDLRDSEHLLKAVFDTSTAGILVIDKRVIIQSVNPAAMEMFGYEAHEMLGRNIGMLMPDLDRLRHDFDVAKYPRTGVKIVIGRRRKLEGLRKNGETFR